MTIAAIPLSELRVSPFNIRQPDDATPEFQQLLASIEANGILEPLVVEPTRLNPLSREASENPGVTHDVLQGGHRLLAARRMARLAGRADGEVPCRVLEGLSEAEAREAALATSVIRRPLHPVDEYEAFATLAAEGLDVAAIARRFGLAERQVRQRLKLAELLPEIRAAWRAGEIGAETAMTFTLAADAAGQAAAFAAYGELQFWSGAGDHERAQRLRRLILGEERGRETTHANRFWLCVGEEAYCAAGGALTENLFADERIVEDPALLQRLAREKALAAADARANALGFGGILFKPSMEQPWSWPRLRVKPAYEAGEEARLEWIARRLDEIDAIDADGEDAATTEALVAEQNALEEEMEAIEDAAAARGLTAEDRARSAVCADIRQDGVITLEDGWLLDATKTGTKLAAAGRIDPAEAKAANARQEERKGPPAAVLQAASEQLTEAAFRSLEATPAAAVPLLLATLRGVAGASPLKLSLTSRYARPASFAARALAEEMTEIVRTPAEDVAKLLAHELARGLNLTEAAVEFQAYGGSRTAGERIAGRAALMELLDALDPGFQARLRGQFDAAAWFAGAPKGEALQAWAELKATGAAPEHEFAGLKKTEIAALLAAEATHQGWLPPLMRTASYRLLTEGRASTSEPPAPETGAGKAKAAKPGKKTAAKSPGKADTKAAGGPAAKSSRKKAA